MTYKEASKRFGRMLLLFLVVGVLSGVTLVSALLGTIRNTEGVAIFWLATLLGVASCVLLYRSGLNRAKERETIRAEWEKRINDFSLFLFLVSHALRHDELSVLMHLWKSDHESHTSRDWAYYQVEESAKTYRGGPEAFLRIILRMCGSGRLECPKKHFHRFVVSDELWSIAKKKYPLSEFSIHDEPNIEVAKHEVEAQDA